MTPLQSTLGLGNGAIRISQTLEIFVAVVAMMVAVAIRRRRWLLSATGFAWISLGLILDLMASWAAPPQIRNVLAGAGIIVTLCGIVRLILDVFDHTTRRAGQEFSAILRDLIGLGLYATIAVVVLAADFQVNVTSLLASLGVLTVVIGLALQETLGNVFSGLALQLQRPFSNGDWIRSGQFLGRVQSIGFRSTTIKTRGNERLEIPNSAIAKEVLTNYGAPPVCDEISIGISYNEPPNRVRETILQATRDIPHVLQEPTPEVLAWEYGDFAIKYRVKYWLVDYAYQEEARNALVTLLWYALRRHAMEIPYPTQTLELRRPRAGMKSQQDFEGGIIRELREVDFLRELSDQELRLLVPNVQLHEFGAGETLVREGDQGDSIYIIRRGVVEVLLNAPDKTMKRVSTLGRSRFIGEQSMLTGAPRNATVRALKDVEVIELNREAFTDLFKKHPEAVAQISEVVSARTTENKEMLAAIGANGGAARRIWLVDKIREIFDL